ncbi:MAG: 2-oxoacid:acceptor oxidoreductase family protein [Thermosulfidibacteraceae bacterium]|jgi:2-oxoglutarate ferredoxin oxidoreductase subunit gamma
MDRDRIEVRLAGFGGQGIIMMGYVLGKAYSIFEGGEATLTQSFGPEARGGACSAQVILSKNRILYPYVTKPDILVVMSQEAYTRYYPSLKDDGILIVEEELVRLGDLKPNQKLFKIPATRLAEEKVGRRLTLNIVMCGFLAAVTGVVSKEAMEKSVLDTVPAGTEEVNLKAFQVGYEYGKSIVG